MALINCPECQKEISDQAVTCTNCGISINQKTTNTEKRPKGKILPIIIAAVIVVGGLGTFAGYQILNDNTAGEHKAPAENNPEEKGNMEEESSIDKLNDDERLVFDCLIIGLSSFFNPASARVTELGNLNDLAPTEALPRGTKNIRLRLQGTNRMGGTLNEAFQLFLKDTTIVVDGTKTEYKRGDLLEASVFDVNRYFDNPPLHIDISKINNALKQYYEELGIT
jgi:hypothetical protein